MVMVGGPNWKYSKSYMEIKDVGLVGYSWYAIGLEVFRDIPTVCR
ncbi:Proline--tRNA ligase [Gossypium arboreum]|uniref:Proline--tRNA ligase n=1 Tax=Gossypium arboreum TaxID=29729 RepID=A0A0B0M632_GOSAR|nr:Proline--tRNA ligase [Gossypium arboreum]